MQSIQKYKNKLVSMVAKLHSDGKITKNSKRAFDRQFNKQMSRPEMDAYVRSFRMHKKNKKISMSSLKQYVKQFKAIRQQQEQSQFMKSDDDMKMANIKLMFVDALKKKFVSKKQKEETYYITAIVSFKKRWISKGQVSVWYTFTKQELAFVLKKKPTNKSVELKVSSILSDSDYEEYDDIKIISWTNVSYTDFKKKAEEYQIMKNKSDELIEKTIINTLNMKKVTADDYIEDEDKDKNNNDIYATKTTQYTSDLGKAEIHNNGKYYLDPMAKVSAIRIDGLNVDEKSYHIENNGQCVPELLFYRYKPILKRLTLEKVKQHLMECKKKMQSILDDNIKIAENESLKIHEKLNDSYNTVEILSFCVSYQISMYAMNENSKVYCKYIADNNKHHAYPPLIFWNIQNHMYLCSDPQFISKISHSERVQIKNAIILDEYQKKEDTREYIDCVPLQKLPEMKDVHIVFQMDNLNKTYIDLLKLENTMYKTKFIDDNITTIYYKNNIELRIDPYYKVTQPGKILYEDAKKLKMRWPNTQIISFADIIDKWRMVKDVCIAAKIPFTCQSIGKLCKDLEGQFYETQKERISLTKEEKEKILKKYKNKCDLCNIDKKLEFHHKNRVADGGSNDIENIQVLCKECHQKKTEEQNEAGEFINIMNSMSFFNKKTKNIIQSQSFKKFAFVEKVYNINCNNTKLFNNALSEKQKNSILGFNAWKCKKCDKKLDTNTVNFASIDGNIIMGRMIGDLKKIMPVCYTCHHLLSMKKQLGHKIDKSKIISIDANKMRKNLMYYANEQWPVFTVFDEVTQFNETDELCTGFYFVESLKGFPLRGNEWMSLPKLKYCLDINLITKSQIKHKFISSIQLPPHFFNKFITYVCSLNETMAKFIINSNVGCMAKTEFKYQTCKYIKDYYEVCEEMTKNKDTHKVPPKKIQYGNGKEDFFYQVLTNHKTSTFETELPIYNQILDLEAIELHKLYTQLQDNGYPIIELNTDAIIVYNESIKKDCKTLEEIIATNFWDNEKTQFKFKFEKKESLLKCGRLAALKNKERYNNIIKSWNIIKDVPDNNFEPLIQEIFKLKSCLLQGPSGAGKTYLLKQIIEILETKKINHLLLAPTNKACRHLRKDAMTCHKLKHSNLRSNSSMFKRLHNIQYIIIDEISMVKESFYIIFQSIKEKFPNIKFIMCGDFNQFLPVAERAIFNYADSNILKELCACNKIQLSTIRRSDKEIINLGNEILKNKNINITNFTHNDCYRHICYTNLTRQKLNYITMKRYLKDFNKQSFKINKYIELSDGMPIICIKKNKKLDIAKNETFIINKIKNKIITAINEDDKEHKIKFNMSDFDEFFDLAFCITAHKAQGCTFNFNYMIHEWNHRYFDWRAKYVAITRAKKMSQVNISPISFNE